MKKERQKLLPTRRKTALRRILIAAAALFLVNRVLLAGLLFPIQAIRHNEEREGTGRTAVVCRTWAREIGWSYLTYLTESENVTMLSGANLTWLGWMDNFGVAVDCTEEAPIHGAYWLLNKDRTEVLYIFGRVDAPDIARLEVQALYESYEDGELVRRQGNYMSCPREDWMERDGRSYFLLKTATLSGEVQTRVVPAIAAYNEAGERIAWKELDQYAASYLA